MNWEQWSINSERFEQLVVRCELLQPLLRRAVEEDIEACVGLDETTKKDLRDAFLEKHQLIDDDKIEAWLNQRQWNEEDLNLYISLPEALDRFALQRFGAGIEEDFLRRKKDLDIVVYSLLRVQDKGLARELWIQLSEGEITFPDAASRHSDGPEAHTKGVLGPFPIGTLQPEVAQRLRHLKLGELPEPEQIGPWWILFRLEQLTPAKLDATMRKRLLQEKLDDWIKDRCIRMRRGEVFEELDYDGNL